MSHIGKNIKKIRSIKKLSQSAFADIFGLSRTSVGSYEEERAEPKIDTLVDIANHFGISIDLLINKELTVNDLYQFDIFKLELGKEEFRTRVDTQAGNKMVLIEERKHHEYILKYKSKEFIQSCPPIDVPLKLNITTRAFEHSGSDMEFNGAGINHGDYLIGMACPVKNICDYRPGQVYTVVLDNRILTRRITELSKKKLMLKPDNPNFPSIEVENKNILELWKVVGIFSTHIKNPLRVNDRIEFLENKVEDILRKIG